MSRELKFLFEAVIQTDWVFKSFHKPKNFEKVITRPACYGQQILSPFNFKYKLKEKIDSYEMIQFFKSIGNVENVKSSKKIDSLFVNDVKIDVVSYPYEWIDTILYEDDIRLATSKEIAAMKIAAITNRGSKKDFYDLNKLLEIFSFPQILDFYMDKFKDGSLFFALKSLIYFDEAEEQEEPLMFDPITWDQVKTNIIQAHSEYLKNH